MRTRPYFRLLAIVIGVVAGIIVAEGLLRLAVRFDLSPVRSFAAFVRSPEGDQSANPEYRKSDDAFLGWELVPFASGGSVRINSDGFRGPEYPREPPSGRKRVAVIGDSEAFGAGLEEDETLSGAVKRDLNTASTNAWEVLNFGVSGYNAMQESRLLETKALKYHPSVVILYYVFNDPVLSLRSFLFAKGPLGRFSLVTLIEWYTFRMRRDRDVDRIYRNDIATDPVGFYRWLHNSEYFDTAATLIRTMARASRERGARFILVIAPEIYGFDDFRNYPYLAIHDKIKALASQDLEVVDPLEDLMALTNNPKQLWVTTDDPHKNREATMAIARRVAVAILGR